MILHSTICNITTISSRNLHHDLCILSKKLLPVCFLHPYYDLSILRKNLFPVCFVHPYYDLSIWRKNLFPVCFLHPYYDLYIWRKNLSPVCFLHPYYDLSILRKYLFPICFLHPYYDLSILHKNLFPVCFLSYVKLVSHTCLNISFVTPINFQSTCLFYCMIKCIVIGSFSTNRMMPNDISNCTSNTIDSVCLADQYLDV